MSRELSLSEWRHWQHKSLPTHVIDHSVRCQHFMEVMKLIDNMKEENEVTTESLNHMWSCSSVQQNVTAFMQQNQIL